MNIMSSVTTSINLANLHSSPFPGLCTTTTSLECPLPAPFSHFGSQCNLHTSLVSLSITVANKKTKGQGLRLEG